MSFVPALTRRASETTAFTSPPRRRTGKAATRVPASFWSAGETIAGTKSVTTWTCKAFTLESTASGAACEAAFGEAWAERRSAKTATSELRITRRSCTSPSLESGTLRRTAGTRHVLHVFVNRFYQRHKLIFAEFAVLIFVELREQLFRVRWLWSAAGFSTVVGALITFGPMSSFLSVLTRLLALLLVSRSHLAHFFASFGALLVIEFAIFIGVEFLEHFFVHFGALVVAFFAVLIGRLRDCRQR